MLRPSATIGSTILALVAALALATILPPTATAVPSLPGTAYKGWQISGYDLHGVPDDLGSQLTAGLSLSGRRKLLRMRYPAFSPDNLQSDLDRVRLFLAQNGYPYAEATPLFSPQPQKRKVRVRIQIDAGEKILLGWTRVEGLPPDLTEKRMQRILPAENEGFSDGAIDAAVKRLTVDLQRRGYAEAVVTQRAEAVDPTHVGVVFVVETGPIYAFGDTRVEGVSPDLIEVVVRTLAVKNGSRYSPQVLERGATNLQVLDLFRKIDVKTEHAAGNVLDVVADLAESDHRSVQAGVGYWTEDRIKLSAQWTARNLLRAGRGVGVQASYSRFLQEGDLTFWKPAMFHSRTRGSIGLSVQRQSEPSYTITTQLVTLAANYLPTARTTIAPSISVARYQVKVLSPGATFNNPGPALLSMAVDIVNDRRNSTVFPLRGSYRHLYIETGFPGFRAQRRYGLLSPEFIGYYPLRRRVISASRLSIGIEGPMRIDDILPNKRYFAGGAGSVRGFQRHMLGPIDQDGNAIGGIARLEASTELRVRLVGILYGAAFFDAGNVWDTREAIGLSGLGYAAGPGLLARSPIGPIRLDVGFRLSHGQPSQPRVVPSISVGATF